MMVEQFVLNNPAVACTPSHPNQNDFVVPRRHVYSLVTIIFLRRGQKNPSDVFFLLCHSEIGSMYFKSVRGVKRIEKEKKKCPHIHTHTPTTNEQKKTSRLIFKICSSFFFLSLSLRPRVRSSFAIAVHTVWRRENKQQSETGDGLSTAKHYTVRRRRSAKNFSKCVCVWWIALLWNKTTATSERRVNSTSIALE